MAVVVDGGQRLVELVRNTRCHLAHRDQPAGVLRTVGLCRCLLLGQPPGRDIGGNHHLGQAAIDPAQVPGAHLEPATEFAQVDLGVLRFGIGQHIGWHAGKRIDMVQPFVADRLRRNARLGHQAKMAIGLVAEPQAVKLVGEQHFVAAQRRHGDRGIQRLEHRGETLERRRQLLTDPVGFGDVGHRSDPARLGAACVDQWRDIQARIEQGVVRSLDPHLHATGCCGLAGQLPVHQLVQILVVGIGPVRKWGGSPDQFGFAPAGHLAKGGIDIGDAALQVHRPHAGEHGVFHGAAEVGFGYQGLLCLVPTPVVPPVGNQHPGRHEAEHADQPEQAAADHAQRCPVRLRPKYQAVADR